MARFYGELVPPRFPLLRAIMQRAEHKRARGVERRIREKKIESGRVLTNEDIIAEFCDYDMREIPWTAVLRYKGAQYGLADETGRPVNRGASALLAKAKKAHRRARREFLFDEKRLKEFEAQQ